MSRAINQKKLQKNLNKYAAIKPLFISAISVAKNKWQKRDVIVVLISLIVRGLPEIVIIFTPDIS